MKITSAEIYNLNLDIGGFPWHPVILRLNTDQSISGLGEAGLAYASGHDAAAGMLKNLVETFVIGADPFRTEWLWENMFRRSFWGQGGGPVVYGGISAIDTALWDIKGKALGIPVYQLLGGKTNDHLRTYASQIQSGWGPEPFLCKKPEDFAREACKAVADGYDAIKVDPCSNDEQGNRLTNLRMLLAPPTVRLFHDRVAAIRDAVGPEVDIIIELHSGLAAPSAIQLGPIWKEFNCLFVEEPSNYLNVDVQKHITNSVTTPMAGGERLYTRWGYRQYLEKQALTVIQPDINLVGGLSEAKKICDYAHLYDVTVQCHVCGSPVATASALHLEAAIPNFQIHEHHTFALKAGNRTLCTPDYQPVKGRFAVPDAPGLGIELNSEALHGQPCLRLP